MLYGDRRLKSSARRIIDSDLPIHYSTASFWEIALKRSAKGFDFENVDDWDILLTRELERLGVVRIDLEPADCPAMESLEFHHRDPFDRLLIAQAIQRRIGIITKDPAFDPYPVASTW
jgi:PIN domain nuclease of toxin-antitoxin system